MARMMVLYRATRQIEHRAVTDLPEILTSGDRLVLNDTRVFPARVFGTWADTGGNIELLLLEPDGENWVVMARSGRKARAGQLLMLADGAFSATVIERLTGGRLKVRFDHEHAELFARLETHGVPPVPPYIRRERDGDPVQTAADRERYQTVYAREVGAVAAPTAGLHFTPALLQRLEARGIPNSRITLHVGPGTFKPVKSDTVEAHVMDAERYTLSPQTAEAVNITRRKGGRIIAVGSTSVRTLETVAADTDGALVAAEGRSSLFIYPPYSFQLIDGMLTNFHLPRSTLLMMISALAGREFVLEAYHEAIRESYRFYSYGDCMLIL